MPTLYSGYLSINAAPWWCNYVQRLIFKSNFFIWLLNQLVEPQSHLSHLPSSETSNSRPFLYQSHQNYHFFT